MIGRTISHYRIIEKLGEGGMGVVYLAEDTVLGRRVAIKTLTARSGNNAHFRSRFLREARAVSALSHPHIATIYDYGETDDNEPYIVMELIRGETLSDLMHKEALTISRAIEIIKQVAEALGEAHRNGIVHRDVKPSNVAINERGNVKVLDFGLAKQLDLGDIDLSDPERQTLLNTQTREGVIIGTPLYLSPEQALGVEVDARSDLFAVGSVLYECVAGKPAFSGGSSVEICAEIIRENPPPPSQLNPDVPPELDRIVLKALSKKPDARYQSADEFVGDLDTARSRILGLDRTITRMIVPGQGTYPTRTLATLSDIFRRPRLPIGYVALAALGILMVVLGALYFLRGRPHQPPAEALRLYEAGENAIRAGAYFQASKALSLAVSKDDEFALAHARLAEAWMELDYSDRAKDELLRASQLFQNRSLFSAVDALYLDAVTATVRRDFQSAVNAYSEIVKLQPQQSHVYVDLGRAYEKNNQPDKAIENYTTAANKDPQNAIAFLRLGVMQGRRNREAEALGAFDKADTVYQALGNVEGRAEVALQRGVFLNDVAARPNDARPSLEQAREIAKVVNNAYQQVRILFQLSSVAIKQGHTDQAQQYANEAIQLAESNQMETLIARGNNEIGNLYFAQGNYSEAERHFQQALDAAQRYGARQNEARARLSLASLYEQTAEADKALPHQEQALLFYQNGGFRTEINQAMNLRGRLFRQKGNYTSALQAFEEQLKFAEQTKDQPQSALAHNSLGSLLSDREKYGDALPHFDQSYEIYRSLNNQLNLGYASMNRGLTKWRLGRSDEAVNDLKAAAEIANRDDSRFKTLQGLIALSEGQIALSDRRFGEAVAKGQQTLDLVGEKNKSATTRGKSLKGLALALSGQARTGRVLCDEAAKTASAVRDPLLLARAQLVLAEAALAAGDAQAAITNAQQARSFFNATGLAEAEWRAWLIEGLAKQKAGDANEARTCLTRAAELLASLEQKWGPEVYGNYLKRSDVQAFRSHLNQIR